MTQQYEVVPCIDIGRTGYEIQYGGKSGEHDPIFFDADEAERYANWLNTDWQTARAALNAVAHGVLSVDNAMKELAPILPPKEIR